MRPKKVRQFSIQIPTKCWKSDWKTNLHCKWFQNNLYNSTCKQTPFNRALGAACSMCRACTIKVADHKLQLAGRSELIDCNFWPKMLADFRNESSALNAGTTKRVRVLRKDPLVATGLDLPVEPAAQIQFKFS